jgi:hypothetical protein
MQIVEKFRRNGRQTENRGALQLADRDLRQMIEMRVARIENQPMLHNQRRDPQIVGRNRGALRPQLRKKPPIVLGRFFVWQGQVNSHFFLSLNRKIPIRAATSRNALPKKLALRSDFSRRLSAAPKEIAPHMPSRWSSTFPLRLTGGDLGRASIFLERHDLIPPTPASRVHVKYRIGISTCWSNTAGQIGWAPPTIRRFWPEGCTRKLEKNFGPVCAPRRGFARGLGIAAEFPFAGRGSQPQMQASRSRTVGLSIKILK